MRRDADSIKLLWFPYRNSWHITHALPCLAGRKQQLDGLSSPSALARTFSEAGLLLWSNLKGTDLFLS